MNSTTPLSLFGPNVKTFSIPEGATEEEKQYIFKLAEEDTIKRDLKRKQKLETSSKIRQEFNYWDSLEISKEDLPRFMLPIFTSMSVSTSEKIRFLNIFCKPYLEFPKLRNELEGKYLYFLNNIFIDVIDSKDNMDYSNSFDTRFVVKIGKLDNYNGYCKTIINSRYKPILSRDKKELTGNVIKSFNTKCYILPDLNNQTFNNFITRNKMLDIGCDISPIFDPEIWNFNNDSFQNSTLHSLCFNSYEYIDMSTCNGLTIEKFIILKQPLYISINGLKPVPIYYFTIPNNPNNIVNIIGMDILSQYTVIFGVFNGLYQCRIMETEDNFWN